MSVNHRIPRQNVRRGRNVVGPHNGVASVGHDGGTDYTTKKQRPTSDRNVAINNRLRENMAPASRRDAGALVAAKIITSQ